MKTAELKVLREIEQGSNYNQRQIAENTGLSLGKTNQTIRSLKEKDYIYIKNWNYFLNKKGKLKLESYRVDNAIIMAAGMSTRFLPLSFETPKGLLHVFGERMIERQIKQLLEKDITDITIVVGYLKERFDYLVDKYGVKLVFNSEYRLKNNLSTLYLVRDLIRNTYILSSDNYMTKNIFNKYEFEAWYSAIKADGETDEWCFDVDGKDRIKGISVGGKDKWHMYGPAFFTKDFSELIVPLIENKYFQPGTNNLYWEDVLKENVDVLPMIINYQPSDVVFEFESLDELRTFDKTYVEKSNNKVMSLISTKFGINESEIKEIYPLKQGVTNKSFRFSLDGFKYVCRIPDEAGKNNISRDNEHQNYNRISSLDISDKLVFMDVKSGLKVSEFEEKYGEIDSNNALHVNKCLSVLRRLHESEIVVEHHFSFVNEIDFYDNLIKGRDLINFEDFLQTRIKMNELLKMLNKINVPRVMIHGDPNINNFLFTNDNRVVLLDWEYSGMGDPLIDIAMFANNHFKKEIKNSILQNYLKRDPTPNETLRFNIYVALSGFLWSLWAIYHQSLGNEFGDYTLRMYRIAKDCYKSIVEEKL